MSITSDDLEIIDFDFSQILEKIEKKIGLTLKKTPILMHLIGRLKDPAYFDYSNVIIITSNEKYYDEAIIHEIGHAIFYQNNDGFFNNFENELRQSQYRHDLSINEDIHNRNWSSNKIPIARLKDFELDINPVTWGSSLRYMVEFENKMQNDLSKHDTTLMEGFAEWVRLEVSPKSKPNKKYARYYELIKSLENKFGRKQFLKKILSIINDDQLQNMLN